MPKGQGEAADALALSGFQRMWFVVLPQSMRIAVPPIGNQYLNLTKNTSLAAVFSFPELTKITLLTVGNRSPAVPSYAPPARDLPGALAGDLVRRQRRQPPPGDRRAVSGGGDGDVGPGAHRDDGDPAARAAAAPAAGPGDWVRRNLFRSPADTVVTIVSGLVVGYVAYRLLRFVFVTGRWDIVRVNLKLFMVGRYPNDVAVADRRRADR